jgi:hypothetical protein
MIILLEWDFHSYDKNRHRIQADTDHIGPPWWPRWLAFTRVAVTDSGGCVDAGTRIQSWITSHPAFENVVSRDYWVPCSTWVQGDEAQMRTCEMMRDDIMVCFQSTSFFHAW